MAFNLITNRHNSMIFAILSQDDSPEQLVLWILPDNEQFE